MKSKPTEPAEPVSINPEVASRVQLICTFCHDRVGRAELRSCASCLAPHHGDCFSTHGACSAPGCAETQTVGPRSPRPLRRWALAAAVLIGGSAALFATLPPSVDAAPDAAPAAVGAAPNAAPVAADATPRAKPPLASRPRPAFVDGAGGPLTVSAELERTAVHDPSRSVHMVVSLKGAEAPPESQRAPAQFALVVDCSSSMSSEAKIGYARKAVQSFMEGLGPRDRCTVIAFSNGVETIVPWFPGNERVPAEKLTALKAGGGTNLYAAIAAGAKALTALPEEERTTLQRVVVLTDGAPSIGVTDPAAFEELARTLQRQDVTLSFHGFGVDVNADLMARCSDLGGGTYLFVDSGELAIRAFEGELARALKTVATKTVVRIEPAPGVVIETIVAYTPTLDGVAQSVLVGDVPAGAERKVVVRLRWSDIGRSRDTVPMAKVTWSSVAVDEGRSISGGGAVVARYAADAAEAEASKNAALTDKLADARFAESMEQVLVIAKSGDARGAHAAAQEAYLWYAEARPGQLLPSTTGDRYFLANHEGVTFYTSLEAFSFKAAECAIPAGVQPVGR